MRASGARRAVEVEAVARGGVEAVEPGLAARRERAGHGRAGRHRRRGRGVEDAEGELARAVRRAGAHAQRVAAGRQFEQRVAAAEVGGVARAQAPVEFHAARPGQRPAQLLGERGDGVAQRVEVDRGRGGEREREARGLPRVRDAARHRRAERVQRRRRVADGL